MIYKMHGTKGTVGHFVRCSPILFVIPIALVLLLPLMAFAAQRQVWGQSDASSGYQGYVSYITAADPGLLKGQWSDQMAGNTGLNGYAAYESGSTKACDQDCEIHPYASWVDSSGNYGSTIHFGVIFVHGYSYEYKGRYIGSGKWQIQAYWDNKCHVLATPNLRKNTAFRYVVAGGETSGPSAKMDTFTTRYNQYMKGGTNTLYYWCYNKAWNNGTGGYISSCKSTDYSWNIHYP